MRSARWPSARPRGWLSRMASPSATRRHASPTSITAPSSIASGRSWAWRMLSAGKLRIEDSSLIVPLSDSTARALICKCT